MYPSFTVQKEYGFGTLLGISHLTGGAEPWPKGLIYFDCQIRPNIAIKQPIMSEL